MDYDDGGVACREGQLVIKRYYPWGSKHIDVASIRGVDVMPLTGKNRIRRWRIWGSGDFIHWWNLDAHRPKKDEALVINVGRRVRPTITPDDPHLVLQLLTGRSGP